MSSSIRLETQVKEYKMIIDGALVDSVNGKRLNIECPASKQIFASVPRGGSQDVDNAVAAAARSFSNWSAVAPRERGKLLLRIADALETEI